MTDRDDPPHFRGRRIRRLPRRESTFDHVTACPRCGVRLSRYNPGPYCNPCDEVVGKPRRPRIRGRPTRDDKE